MYYLVRYWFSCRDDEVISELWPSSWRPYLMPHLLILPRLRFSFERSIRPLLRARGLRTEQSATQLLYQLLRDQARLWVCPLNRPRPGIPREVEIPTRAQVVVLDEQKDRDPVFLLSVDD